jgi:hypothetical protein
LRGVVVALIILACVPGAAPAFAGSFVPNVPAAASPAPSRDGDAPVAPHLAAIHSATREACARHAVLDSLVLAVGIVESGLWPWSLNLEGRSLKFASEEKLLAFLRDNSITWRRSFDVGTFQINSQWGAKFGYDIHKMLDIRRNADFAAWLLRDGLTRFHGDWQGVAAYHTSKDNDQAVLYVRMVLSIAEELSAGKGRNTR